MSKHGEAPVDTPLSLNRELQELAWSVDSCITDRIPRGERERLQRVADRLEEMAGDIDEWQKRTWETFG